MNTKFQFWSFPNYKIYSFPKLSLLEHHGNMLQLPQKVGSTISTLPRLIAGVLILWGGVVLKFLKCRGRGKRGQCYMTMLKMMASHHQGSSRFELFPRPFVLEKTNENSPVKVLASHHFKPCMIFLKISIFVCVYIMFVELLCSDYCWKNLFALLGVSNFELIMFYSGMHNPWR